MQYEKENKFKNIVKRQFKTLKPNEIWVSDVTYIRIRENPYYICVIIDLFSRKVLSYKIGLSNSTQLTKATFKTAYNLRKPTEKLIFHTDRGGNFCSKSFTQYLSKFNIEQSFSKPGTPYDNSVVESFFATLKREELYRTKYRSKNEFKTSLDEYIIFYNTKRIHTNNAYKTPDEKEAEYYSQNAD